MATLRIYLLGPLRFEVNRAPVTGFVTQKAELLLAYLAATAPKVHSRESLATLFWPESAPDAARYNLRYALWSIRNVLREADLSPDSYLRTDHETCQFAPTSGSWRDTDAFTEKSEITATSEVSKDLGGLAQRVAGHLQDAVALYRGGFLEGVRVPDCPLLEEWLTFERERWRDLYLETLERLIEAFIAGQDHDQAIAHSREILRIDPLRESAHRRLMQLYWLAGQRTMALRQYEICDQLLREELDIEPLAATQEFYHRVREGGPPPGASEQRARTPPFSPPASPLRRFAGREQELTTLRSYLEKAQLGHGYLILVAGEAGIGKTRLLQEFAQEVASQASLICWGDCFPGERGLPYQPLIDALRSAVGQLDAAKLRGLPAIWMHEVIQLVPELAQHLTALPAIPSLPPEQAKNRLYEGIAQFLLHAAAGSVADSGLQVEGVDTQPSTFQPSNLQLLLLLDNLQWADESTFQLLGFLIRRLAPAGALFVAAYRPEDVLADHPLVELERAQSREALLARMELSSLSEADVMTLVDYQTQGDDMAEGFARWLYRESEGNPFFIIETVQALLDNGLLDQRPEGTWCLSPDLMPKIRSGIPVPQTIRDVILSRVDRLDAEARDVLALAAVMGRHFQYDALCQASDLSEARLLTSLQALLNRRLIRETEVSHYEFTHDKIQQTVYETMPGDYRAYRHRLAGAALEHLHDDPAPVIGELARHFRRGGEERKAFDYLVQAGDRARTLHAHQEALRHYGRTLELGRRLTHISTATLAEIHEKMSDIQMLMGTYQGALDSYQAAMELAGEEADPLTRAALWRKIGRLHERQGDYEKALAFFEHGSRALPAEDSPAVNLERARLERERAWVRMRQGRYDQARQRLRAAIGLIHSDPQTEAQQELGRLWTVLGIVDWYQSDYAEAAANLEQGLRIKETISDDYGIGRSYNNLGLVYRSLGHYDTSLSHHDLSLDVFERIGDMAGQASCLHNIGLVHYNRGEYQEAIACYEQSREMFERIGFATGLPALYNDLGEAYLGLGDEEQALQCLEKGLRIAEEVGSRVSLSAIHSAVAATRLRLGQPQPALEHAQKALNLARETDVDYDRAVAHRVLGEILAATQPHEAQVNLQRSLEIAESLGERTQIAKSRRAYGRFQCAQDDPQGLRYLQQAHDLFAELGARAELEKTEALLKHMEHDA